MSRTHLEYIKLNNGSVFIFCISVFLSISLLIIERFFGIGWDYHPDSETYIRTSSTVVYNIFYENPLYLFNQMFFLVTSILNQNITAIIIFNILIYSLTNVLLVNEVFDDLSNRSFDKRTIAFLVFLIIASPYRVHLSIHILKDTLIIFFVVLIYISVFKAEILRYLKNIIKITFLVSLRIFGIVYLIPSFKLYSKLILAFISIIVFIIFYELILDYLRVSNELDLNFREYDSVPSFNDLGIVGMIIRMIVWPILVFTGAFIVFSPSLPFLIMSIGSLFYFFFSMIAYKKLPITFWVFGVLAVVAALVPGFTSYIRYCYPLLIITPLIHMFAISQNQKRNIKANLVNNI